MSPSHTQLHRQRQMFSGWHKPLKRMSRVQIAISPLTIHCDTRMDSCLSHSSITPTLLIHYYSRYTVHIQIVRSFNRERPQQQIIISFVCVTLPHPLLLSVSTRPSNNYLSAQAHGHFKTRYRNIG